MDNCTTVYVVRDSLEDDRFVALFMNGGEAEDYTDKTSRFFYVEEHYMPNETDQPWLFN